MIEYKVVTLRNTDPSDSADLNILAKDGWRVVTCAHVSGQGIVVIMVRWPSEPEPKQPPVLVEKGTTLMHSDGTVVRT